MTPRILFVFTCFILFSAGLNAQRIADPEIDSLVQRSLQSQRNPEDFRQNAQTLLEVSKQKDNLRGQLAANQFLSRVALRSQNYQEAFSYCQDAIKLAKQADNPNAYHAITNTLASVHFQTKYYDSALFYYRDNLAFFKNEARQKFLYYQTKRNIGNIYLRKNELDSAEYYLNDALKGFEAINNKMFAAQTYNMLSEISLMNKKYDTAFALAGKSLELTKAINFRPNLATTYNLLGRISDEKGDADAAESYFDLAEKSKMPIPKGAAIDGSWVAKEQSVRKHKNKRIDTLNSEKSFYRSNLFIAFVVLVFLAAISVFFYRKNKNTKKEVGQLQKKLDDFNIAYEKLKSKNSGNTLENKRLELPSGKLLNLEDVVYLKSDAHYVEIYLEETEGALLERISLTKILDLLPDDGFIRTQKSYAVNIHKIKIINATQLMMTNGVWVKLSPNYKAKLKTRLHAN